MPSPKTIEIAAVAGLLGVAVIGAMMLDRNRARRNPTKHRRLRRNPPLMEGSAAVDLQQEVARVVNKFGSDRRVRYSDTGNGDLRVTGTVDGDSVGYLAAWSGPGPGRQPFRYDLQKIAAKHGFRYGYSDGENALLFRKV
jgi:hypothetical protein